MDFKLTKFSLQRLKKKSMASCRRYDAHCNVRLQPAVVSKNLCINCKKENRALLCAIVASPKKLGGNLQEKLECVTLFNTSFITKEIFFVLFNKRER